MNTTEELRYRSGGKTIADYDRELDELWQELQDPNSDLHQEAVARGINVEALLKIPRKEAISMRAEGAAFGAEVTLIVALAPLATELVKAAAPIIKDLWTDVFRPRIVQKWGGQVLAKK